MKFNIKLMSFLFLFINSPLYALDFKVSFWWKETCQGQAVCLPQAVGSPQLINLPEPPINSFSRIEVVEKPIKGIITLAKRADFGGYYSFQIEIVSEEGKTLALCSRYEALDTFEDVPVGACSGLEQEEDKMVGLSILRP